MIPTRYIWQGEFMIARDPACVLTTLLGSCVSACIWDPLAKLGGMNHFLLPGEKQEFAAERYGVHLMELLVNGLLREGAARGRLRCKLFGGSRMNGSTIDIGARNAAFARKFLDTESIELVSESLGGYAARKVQFWPTSGRARQLELPSDPFIAEAQRPLPEFAGAGQVELF